MGIRKVITEIAADDDSVREGVRAKLRHYASHPGSIQVQVDSGKVVLTGPIRAPEVNPLLKAVRRVRGVKDVTNNLEARSEPRPVGGLPRNRFPSVRFVVGLLLAGLIGRGIFGRGVSRLRAIKPTGEDLPEVPDELGRTL